MKEEKIISVLIGLAGACNNNPKTANTDSLAVKALSFPLLCPEPDDTAISSIVNEIYSEKNAVAPGCAACAAPCGNTSDYDMNRIYEAEYEIRKIKLEILCELQKLAAYLHFNKELKADCKILYKGLSYVSYDMEKEGLTEFLDEIKRMEQELGIKEDSE